MKYGLWKRTLVIAVSCFLAMPSGVAALAEESENGVEADNTAVETTADSADVGTEADNTAVEATADSAAMGTAGQEGDSGVPKNIELYSTGISNYFSQGEGNKNYKILLEEESDGTKEVAVQIQKDALTDNAGTEYYLAQVRYQCGEGEEQAAIRQSDTKEQYEYKFDMPKEGEPVSVTADFIPIVWDGTIDLTWYDPERAEFDIYYPAQLAGAAALCNGIFDNYPMTVDENGNTLPAVTKTGQPTGSKGKYYNTYSQTTTSQTQGSTTRKTVVVGDISFLKAIYNESASGSGSDSTTDLYWYGGEDFAGKTLYLMSDLDMGGRRKSSAASSQAIDAVSSASQPKAAMEVYGGWSASSPYYMPIGGQYCMDPDNGYTKLSASFNGTLNGQGYTVKNIYCDRWSTKYGDSQSIGLIGRLGCHDNDPKDKYASPLVKNVAVDGVFYGQRSVGGIVGKNGKSNGSVIENCLNFATVLHTGAKGGGGIAGAGWNSLTVKNCANFGYIWLEFQGDSGTDGGGNAGGLIGSSEAVADNCYSVGYVYSAAKNRAQSLGTNNGGAVWRNCYYLAKSSSSEEGIFGSNTLVDRTEEISAFAGFLDNAFLQKINGENGRAWVSGSSDKIKSDGLKDVLKTIPLDQVWLDGRNKSPTNMTGTAIPRVFTNDNSKVCQITMEGAVKRSGYVEGQKFDFGDWKMKAYYDDETHEIVEISDAYISYGHEGDCFSADDKQVTVTVPMAFAETCEFPSTGNDIKVSQEGNNCVITFAVDPVSPNEVDHIEITKAPKQTYYVVEEAFHPEGMEVTATYTNGKKIVLSLQAGGTDDNGSDSSAVAGGTDDDGSDSSAAAGETDDDGSDSSAAAGGTEEDSYSCSYMVEGGDLNCLQTKDTEISVTYTFRGKTESAVQKITVVDLKSPVITNNVVQIREVSDFLWFAYQMKNGAAYNAILLNDIDLSPTGFVPVGLESSTAVTAKAYTGTFDGNGKTVTLDYHGDGKYNALFAFSEKGAVIKNLTVSGSVERSMETTVTESYVAGIVAYSNGGTITDCVNQASLAGTNCIGGIAAYVSGTGDTEIRNCANRGTVSGESGSLVGGIAGSICSGRINSCYNIGALHGYRTGGIVGRIFGDLEIQNCYNRGEITGTESGDAGGIVGRCEVSSMTLKNCYNTGAIKGTSAFKGAVMGFSWLTKLTNVSGNYSTACGDCEIVGGLAETASAFAAGNARYTGAAELKTLADMKASTAGLGTAYRKDLKPINDGYPILVWQISKEMSEEEYNRLAEAQKPPSSTSLPSTQTPPSSTSPPSTQTSIPKKGASLKSGKVTYKVTKTGAKNKTVEYYRNSSASKTVTVPATVKVNGISYKVTSIAKSAFKGNKKLTTVKIGSNVKTIGTSAFSGCTKLQKVTIGKNVTTIGVNAFYNCKALKTVAIGANVTKISSKAFANCTKLTKITIPAKVKSIGKQAFYGCRKLKSITIKTSKLTKKTVGSKAFTSIHKNATIKVPKKKQKTYKTLLKARGIGSKAVVR